MLGIALRAWDRLGERSTTELYSWSEKLLSNSSVQNHRATRQNSSRLTRLGPCVDLPGMYGFLHGRVKHGHINAASPLSTPPHQGHGKGRSTC